MDALVFRQREKIEYLKTVAIAVASANPDSLGKIVTELESAIFPELKHDRLEYIKDRMKLMEQVKDWVLFAKRAQ